MNSLVDIYVDSGPSNLGDDDDVELIESETHNQLRVMDLVDRVCHRSFTESDVAASVFQCWNSKR